MGTDLSLSADQARIAVVGLGYVGLPLAIEFGSKLPTVGFDINEKRIAELARGHDITLEVDDVDFCRSKHLEFSYQVADLKHCNTYLITVPTPIDASNRPDLEPLRSASRTIGQVLSAGDVVVYESTVFPGATEEVCVPILEKLSGLKLNKDFYVGYSPERINPGDKQHRLPNILKVTSGSTPAAADYIDKLYQQIITAGTHKTSSIRVAEAAKVIENTQRDLNIALINELAKIFEKLEIDTQEVLAAAGTKWNFLPFQPGLVGGHCIGVDPYYLTHKAQEVGFHPQVILAGRRTNDSMGEHIADRVIKLMARRAISPVGANILLLGLTFKENCPDLRNTKVVDLYQALSAYHCHVDVYDPLVDADEAQRQYNIEPIEKPAAGTYDAIIVAVAHDEFKTLGEAGITAFAKPDHVIFDVKNLLPKSAVSGRL